MKESIVKYNNYWPIYKNLEGEVLRLSDTICFSDDQKNVYSSHIADLIVRCAIEIESISKELFLQVASKEEKKLKKEEMYFDTVCLNKLEQKWGIGKKTIVLSAANMFFCDEDIKRMVPLDKAYKRGSSGSKWNKAYQALKHDRANSIKKGNIENLLYALGALFVLNIYYKDEVFELRTNKGAFDSRCGSEVFSVVYADASRIAIGNDVSDDSIDHEVREQLESAIYVLKYTEETYRTFHERVVNMNESMLQQVRQSAVIIKFLHDNPNYKIDSLADLANDAGGIELLNGILENANARSLIDANLQYEGILNKGQQIYPSLTG